MRRIVPLSRCVADAAPYGGIVPRSAYPVGVGVPDDPVRRFVTLARCVEDAAPYDGAIWFRRGSRRRTEDYQKDGSRTSALVPDPGILLVSPAFHPFFRRP